MRVAMVRPGCNFSVADVHRGWLNAFRQVATVVDINLDDRLTRFDKWITAENTIEDNSERYHAICRLTGHTVRADLYDFWPDLVVIVSGFYLPPDWYEIVRSRHRTVLLCTESPYEDDRQLMQAGLVDAVVLNDPTNLEQFRAVNPNVWYAPHCYDPTIHSPAPPEPDLESDFCFVGTGYPSRVEFFEQVDWTDIDVCLAGNWQWVTDASPLLSFLEHERGICCENTDAVRLYRATKVAANLYRKETTGFAPPFGPEQGASHNDGWACGPREIELAATGTFFLREPRGESDELFPHLPTFTTPAEFETELRYWLERPDDRAALADKSRAAVQDRTFDRNVEVLLDRLF